MDSKNRPDWESRIMYPDVVGYYLSTICTLPEHLSSPVVFRLLDHQFYMYVLQIVVCPFVLFLLAIVLSVLRYTDSDYPFGIFKLFFLVYTYIKNMEFGIKCILMLWLISSPGPKVHVNYCHHLASVVCRLSSVNFSHFKLLLRNHLAD